VPIAGITNALPFAGVASEEGAEILELQQLFDRMTPKQRGAITLFARLMAEKQGKRTA
jgi:hypothetical protein